MLKALHSAPLVEHDEVLLFIEDRKLNGLGLGWVDVHLLASAYAAKLSIWAFDKRLTAVAQELDLASPP